MSDDTQPPPFNVKGNMSSARTTDKESARKMRYYQDLTVAKEDIAALLKKEEARKREMLRDRFAMAALPAIITEATAGDALLMARDAYRVADAMLKAREAK